MRKVLMKRTALMVLAVFPLQLIPKVAMATWLCPANMMSYQAAATCAEACKVGCIESGTFSCGYADADGNAAFVPCVAGGLVCPIGDFQCYEGNCSAFGECTSSSSDYTTHYCSLNETSYATDEECKADCFYQSYTCSATNEKFYGIDPDTKEIIPPTVLYGKCQDKCFSCPDGMYYFEPQSICIQQLCEPGDPFCNLEVSRVDPVCTDGDGFSFDSSANLCSKIAAYNPVACTDSGNGEYQCPATGSLFSTLALCTTACKSKVCDAGEISGGNCIYAPICTSGTYNATTKKCEKVVVGTAAPTNGSCIPYDTQKACQTYFSYASQWICKENAVAYQTPELCKATCADDTNCVGATDIPAAIQGYMRMDTFVEFPTLAACQADIVGDPDAFCEGITRDDTADWTCDINGTRYADKETCVASCRQDTACTVSSEPLCPVSSHESCFDIGQAANYVDADDSASFSSYDNDGEMDETGRCLGQVYLFNGSVMECKPPGIKTGYNNCCEADADVLNTVRDQINSIGIVVNVAKAAFYASQAVAAYEAYTAATAAGDAFALESVSVTYGADVAEVAATSASASEAAAGGIMNGFAITPTGAVIAAAIYIAMEVLLKACDPDDVYTAALDELGLCHYLERLCTTDGPFGCVQRTKYYCCFNSKLARIIHEQGRPQLQAFQDQQALFRPTLEDGDYDCRGFTPTEFSMLDFTKIDLSEYYGDIQEKVNNLVNTGLPESLQDSAAAKAQQKAD